LVLGLRKAVKLLLGASILGVLLDITGKPEAAATAKA